MLRNTFDQRYAGPRTPMTLAIDLQVGLLQPLPWPAAAGRGVGPPSGMLGACNTAHMGCSLMMWWQLGGHCALHLPTTPVAQALSDRPP